MSSTARRALARLTFAVLAAVGGVVGGWASVSPRGFFRDFPGAGRHWLPPLGPYNEHLLRDFGALNLALAAAALVAAVTLTRSAALTAAAAWVVYSVPHLVFHAEHTAPYSPADNAANLAGLAAAVVLAVVGAWLAWPQAGTRSRRGASVPAPDENSSAPSVTLP